LKKTVTCYRREGGRATCAGEGNPGERTSNLRKMGGTTGSNGHKQHCVHATFFGRTGNSNFVMSFLQKNWRVML